MNQNIRYKTAEVFLEQDERRPQTVTSLKPQNYNYYSTSQTSQKTLNAGMKSRSKHQTFKPSLRSQSEHSEKIPMYSDAVSEYGTRNIRKNNDQTFGNQSQQNYNQLESRYKNIQNILQQQNHNLKEQNELLMYELKKMANKQRKYKDLFQQTRQELIITQQQRDSYHDEAEQLKIIAQNQMRKFEDRLNMVSTSQEERGALLASGFNDFRNKLSLGKSPSQMSDNTNSETMY